jgi:hypothetical protein
MSTIPGLFVLGEANFSDHGANRLGASALMQGLADGYFVIPYTIGGYLAGTVSGIGVGHKRPLPTAPGKRPSATASCCPSAATAPCATFTPPWARSCGMKSAWPATKPGLNGPSA